MARPYPHPSNPDAGTPTFCYTTEAGTLKFPATTSLQMQCIPQYDHANRLVKYLRYRLTIDVTLVPEDQGFTGTMDAAMVIIKKILSTPGGDLKLHGLGLGTNFQATQAEDLSFGPHPLELRIRPVGFSKALHIYWAVEFTLPICTLSVHPIGFTEFTYTIEFTVIESGACTRTTVIQAEFPVQRNDQKITASADDLLAYIKPKRLPGFHRTHHRLLSPDKKQLTYTITDTEIPSDNPYMIGMVHMDVKQRVRSAMQILVAGNFIVDMTGTLEHAVGFSKAQCWEAFRLIVRERLKNVHLAVMPTSEKKTGSLILMGLNVEDDIFSRRISVSFTWRIMCNLNTLFKATGLFQGTQSNWAVWSNAMEQKIPPTGRFDLRHTAGDEMLIDLCHPAPIGKDSPAPPGTPTRFLPTPISPGMVNDSSGWDWQPFLSLYRKTSAVTISTTGGGDSSSTLGMSLSGVSTALNSLSGFSTEFALAPFSGGTTGDSGGLGTGLGTSLGKSLVHSRSSSKYEIVFRGSVWRIGTPPPVPRLKKIGGTTPAVIEQRIDPPTITAMTVSGPIYRVSWFERFSIPEFHGKVDVEIEDAPPTNTLTTLSSEDAR